MIFTYYKETALEQWITELYSIIDVLTPQDLDIHVIADRLNIEVVYEKCRPFCDANKRVIFLRNNFV